LKFNRKNGWRRGLEGVREAEVKGGRRNRRRRRNVEEDESGGKDRMERGRSGGEDGIMERIEWEEGRMDGEGEADRR
jgi:hypothetical protein